MLKKDTPADQYAAADAFRKKSLAQLRKMVKSIKTDSPENITTFKRAFILYIQKALLCPNNSGPLDPKTLITVLDVSNPREMNWARHVLGYLVQSIKDSIAKNQKSVDGCVFALLIIYLQETHFDEGCQDEEAQPPWIDYWKGETLQEKIKVEFEDPIGLVAQARERMPRKTQKKTTTKGMQPKKAEALGRILPSSLEAKGQILWKRKHVEESDYESELEYESESEDGSNAEDDAEDGSHAEYGSDSEATVYEDPAVGRIERRTKMRHEGNAANAEPIPPPPHHVEGEHNVADARVGNAADSSSQHTVNLSSDENLTPNVEYVTRLGDSQSQGNEKATHKDDSTDAAASMEIDDTNIVEEERTMSPAKDIEPVVVLALEKLAKGPVILPGLTLKDMSVQKSSIIGDATSAKDIEQTLKGPDLNSTSAPKVDYIPTDQEIEADIEKVVGLAAGMGEDDYDNMGFTPPSFDLGCFSQPLVVTASQGQPQMAEIHGKQPKMTVGATVSQGQSQIAEIHGISDKTPIMKMEPKMSQDKDATPTPSQEDLLTPATLEALEKLHEETAKKLLSKQAETEKKQLYTQAEAKMSDILRMRAAIQAFDNIDKLDTTAEDAEDEEEPKTPRKRLYKWATEGEENIMYKFLFRYDCGVHVLKYLEVVNPLELNKKSYKVPAFSQEQLNEYREEIVERILLNNDNFYKVEPVQATVPRQRQSRPSRHIQSPFVQLNSSDIESGKSKDK
ncbi:hypothetical protein PIB30_068199 [Stylosanthes scabra]|uniref:Uncharacterized protein n=1 Tax=Stylosanthes scabra TaxID=79078 RepID=A0ABU6ZLK5_9FABA|nr:hypothetical protein [Stylosanthes scabra]